MNRYLLDSHIFLWWLSDSDKLETNIYDIIADTRNTIYISSATIWEISIKEALGKLEVDTDLDCVIGENGFIELKISAKCANATKQLPLIHKDPFDRMLISQAIEGDMTLISVDKFISQYNDAKVLKTKKV